MQELLLGTWGLFAGLLVGAWVLDLMFANGRSGGDAGVGGWDFGDGGGWLMFARIGVMRALNGDRPGS